MIIRLLTILLCMAPIYCAAAETKADTAATTTEKAKTNYIPAFHGTFRAFYEMSTATGESRFMVRNARLAAGGNVLPIASYFLQVDLCDRGRMKILDAYISVSPAKGLKLMAGQMRVPFSVSASRAPALYYFANRPFVAKHFGNLRAVGVKAGYTLPSMPLYFEGGVFNGTDMSDHTGWNKHLTYSVKANYTSSFGLKPEIGFMSRLPGSEGVRINQLNASLSWKGAGWYIEGEYGYRHYTGKSHKASHAYSIFADYGFPLRSRIVNRWSFQARFDGLTDASNGKFNSEGKLETTWPACRRITVGTTASYLAGRVHCDFRINCEQYFYSSKEAAPDPADNNKLVAALILYF